MSYERPVGFSHEQRDCVVRSLSLCANIPYEDVHYEFMLRGRKDGHRLKKAEENCKKVFANLGLSAKQVKRSGTLRSLIKKQPVGNLFCLMRGHAFCVLNGVAHDVKSENVLILKAWLITKSDVRRSESLSKGFSFD